MQIKILMSLGETSSLELMQKVAEGLRSGEQQGKTWWRKGRKELGSEGALGKGPTGESLKVLYLNSFILFMSAQASQFESEQFF